MERISIDTRNDRRGIQKLVQSGPQKKKLSPLVMAMHTESGGLNKFVHIWSYESLDHRAEVRSEAAAKGIWPPKGRRETLQIQTNKIVLPASFSPWPETNGRLNENLSRPTSMIVFCGCR